MDHKRAVEVLGEIERLAEINDLRADGLCLWPLLRLDFWTQLLRPPAERRAPAPQPRWQLKALPGVRHWLRWRERRKLRRLPRAEALFLSRHEDYGDRFDGGFYNRHADPVIEFCRDKMSCLKIEAHEPPSDTTSPRLVPTGFLKIERLAFPRAARLQRSESLRATLAKIDEPLAFDQEGVEVFASVLLQWRDAFLAVLDHVQPRVVFVVCYYDRRVLPLVAACRERGIPVVDIQHGKQGVFHGAYTHWTRWPDSGYELLPDFFWVWGEASRRNIAASQPAELKRHRAVVGGNRWLALWRRGGVFPVDPQQGAWLVEVRKARRVILVTLQPIDPPIPPCVREAVNRSPEDWLWLFRVHPQRKADIPSLAASLTGNYEFERASTAPLYALLRNVDCHITCWSSVAFEASAFGVPTMIVHPSGRQLYAEDIAAGRFAYTASGDELMGWIESAAAHAAETEPYIETDDARASGALAEILAAR